MRLTLGLIFVAHGLRQFRLVWRRQHGRRNATAGPATGEAVASLCGLGNLAGGLMIALGALTFLGCALIITTMVVATMTLKAHSGFWERFGGYEYNLCVIGTAAAIALMGPGPISLDAALAPGLIDAKLFLIALVVSLAVAGLGLYRANPPLQNSDPS